MSGMRLKSHRNSFITPRHQSGNQPWSDKFRPSPWATPPVKQDANPETNSSKPRPIVIAPPPPMFFEAPVKAKAVKRAPARKTAAGTKKRTAAKPKKTAKRAVRKSVR